MPKKRRNNGRGKTHKGHSDPIHCDNCHRLVPKDKAIKRYLVKNIVDASSKRDIEEMSVCKEADSNYSMPKLFVKNQYCVSCGIHARIVRVRSTTNRRVRYISNCRPALKGEHSQGLYLIAGQNFNQKGPKPEQKNNPKPEEKKPES